jgi:hypothetical protein
MFCTQRASEVGFLFLTWVSKPVLNCPSLQCNRVRQRRGAVLVNAQLLKAIAELFFVKRG